MRAIVSTFVTLLAFLASAAVRAERLEGIPAYSHVAVLVLENQSFDTSWGAGSVAAYLNALRQQGTFAFNYYATGHASLGNYIAMVSGQPTQPATASDCTAQNLYQCVALQQAFANGRNLADQLEEAGVSWKGYMDAMPSPCFHGPYSPTALPPDPYQGNSDQPPAFNYADRHNPFLYFRDIIENDARCADHVRPFTELAADLAADELPAFVFITPDTCHDGHDDPCANGSPGGLVSADLWLQQNVPALLTYLRAHNGVLLITFDESDVTDTAGCCTGGPGGTPGFGGRVGLLALGAHVDRNSNIAVSFDHASLLRTLEDAFGISEHLNNAATAQAMTGLFLPETPPPAATFLLSAPRAIHAGEPFTLNLAALDADGRVVTSFNGAVAFTSGDAGALLPPPTTLTSTNDSGVHSFSGVVLATPGQQTVHAPAIGNPILFGDGTVGVLPAETPAAGYVPLAPCRAVDTRQPAGPAGGPKLQGGAPRSFTLAGSCGVPAGASAVALNVTAVTPTAAGGIEIFAAGAAAPGLAVVAFRGGQTRANNAIVALSAEGALTAQADLAGSVELVLDVVGYFLPFVQPLPIPAFSGLDHVVVVVLENRSFDHLLGWLPGAEGRQAGLAFAVAGGGSQATHALAPDFQGCAFLSPGQSYAAGRVQYDLGLCDGWLLPGSNATVAEPARANDAFAAGYYTAADLAFLGAAAPRWTALDRYFSSIMAESVPNRLYLHTGQTDRLSNTQESSTLITLWDRLQDASVPGTYYFSDTPFLSIWAEEYAPISRPFAEFLADCAAGTLPAVSFVDPRFAAAEQGLSGDDHPHGDVRAGEAFLNQIYDALRASPVWPHSALIVTFSSWGGFFDHVPPPPAFIPDASKGAGDFDGRLGFRVPALVVSPFARRGYVSHETFDHTSILRLIEWRWGLNTLTGRDFAAHNLANVLDFAHPDLTAPSFTVPPPPTAPSCPVSPP